MRKIALIILGVLLCMTSHSQNLLNTAFNTNGPVGELLFEQNDKGEIVYSGVVEVDFSSDTLFGLAREYFYRLDKSSDRIKISNQFDGITMVACDVELQVGSRLVVAPYAGAWVKAASTVSFNVVIDIRQGKFRYTLTNFITDRWRIPGEGKDRGQSNLLHWQRVNSLNNELSKVKEKERPEIQAMIEKEKESYQSEYDAVMAFIESLKGFATIEDF